MHFGSVLSDPKLLNLHLVLVELFDEEAVLLLKVVDRVSVLFCRLDAALKLQPQSVDCLLSVIQLHPQCFLFSLQSLTLTLSIF